MLLEAAWQRVSKMAETKEILTTLKIAADRVPFLIGIKGRNVSLIGKHTGTFIKISGERVDIVKRENAQRYDPGLAERLVLGICEGGILKWFSNPHATATQYPENIRTVFDDFALKTFDCRLHLLRARTGHMALVLVPATPASAGNVAVGRVALLQRLADLHDLAT